MSPFGVIPSDTLLCTSSDSESSERRHDEESTSIECVPQKPDEEPKRCKGHSQESAAVERGIHASCLM